MGIFHVVVTGHTGCKASRGDADGVGGSAVDTTLTPSVLVPKTLASDRLGKARVGIVRAGVDEGDIQ